MLSAPAMAAVKTWDGGGDGVNWNSANNWNPNGVPGTTDDITIDCSCTVFYNINADLEIFGTLTIASGSYPAMNA